MRKFYLFLTVLLLSSFSLLAQHLPDQYLEPMQYEATKKEVLDNYRSNGIQTKQYASLMEGRVVNTTTTNASFLDALLLFPGTLTTAEPTFNRPLSMVQGGTCTLSGVGTAVRYRTHTFTMTTAGNVTVSLVPADGASITPAGADTFLALYGPSGFNPAAPCTNLIAANDDAVGLLSRIITTTPLAAGTYTAVVTSFDNAPTDFPWTYNLAVITPDPTCTGVPSPGLISGPAAMVCTNTSATLNLSGFTSGTGITFQWKSSATAGGPYTTIPGATNSSYTFTTNTTTYFICTVTCSGSGLSANTTEFVVNVNKPIHTVATATPATTCSPGSSVITGTAANGVLTAGVGVLASSGAINLAIPDNLPAGANTSITLPATTFTSANNLQIRINASHTWVGDLKFTLTSPCGTTFLFDRPGVPVSTVGNSDNLGTATGAAPPPAVYTFDLAAATVIPETNVGTGFIATGSYRPSDVNGAAHNWAGFTFPCNGGGTWTLNVSDNGVLDTGTLVDWAILGPTTGVYTHSLTGPGTIGPVAVSGANNATATYNVSNLPAGVHTFTLTSTDMMGCSVSTPLTVTVNQTPAITFTPAAPVICNGAVQQITASVTPPASTQTFSSGAINLAIPDNLPVGANTAPIVLPSGLNIASANQLRVRINARHSWVGDVKFTLTSPCGTTFLFDRPGVPASTFGNSANLGTSNAATPPPAVYIFDLAAATVIPETAPASGFIPTGSYRPSDANGAAHNWAGVTFPCAATGNWVLNVSDAGAGDVGVLVDWAIIYDIPAPVTFSPVTNLFTDAAATVAYTGTPVTTIWAKPTTTTTYTATATVAGCTNTANVTVTVNQLPAITTQPAALATPLCPGFNAVYTVAATGTGLTYQWELSTNGGTSWAPVVNGPAYSGATTASLTVISTTTAQNLYQYRVIVSGTCPPAVTSTPVVLTISTPPTITTQPANLTRCDAQSASFSVVTGGVPAPTIFQWFVSTDGGTTFNPITLANTPTFNIAAVTTAMNNNRYRVVVTNICGQTVTSSAAILTVNPVTPVTVTALPARICLSDTLVALSASPTGGSWSGIGVSGFNFVPGTTAVGTYPLTYTFTNSFGCVSANSVSAIVQDCPERTRLLRDNAVILFPNPNSGNFFLRMNSTLYNYLGMDVYSSAGQVVAKKQFHGLVFGRVIPINLTHLPAGTYLVKFFYDDGVRTSEKTFTVIIGR